MLWRTGRGRRGCHRGRLTGLGARGHLGQLREDAVELLREELNLVHHGLVVRTGLGGCRGGTRLNAGYLILLGP